MYIDKYETGTDNTREIARFDTLELTTLVMKYMRGDSLSEAEAKTAREAIKKVDMPTD